MFLCTRAAAPALRDARGAIVNIASTRADQSERDTEPYAAVKGGVVVVRSSRTNGGVIRRNIEVNDDEAGTVASMALNPGKARVLLQLALMKTKDAKKIQDYFDRY